MPTGSVQSSQQEQRPFKTSRGTTDADFCRYAVWRIRSHELAWIPADGSERTPRPLRAQALAPQVWSADGRELFYRQGDAVMAVAVETGNEFSFAAPKPLFSGPYVQSLSPNSRSYDVARDGRFLMILPGDENRAAAPASIVVVQNFGEEIKQRVRPTGK